MSTPTEQQPQEAPESAPAMVRACDRCGTVCAADQEWCLNCGVRMTDSGQRLPGLRTAGLVVALAVLLAGGAAAASYAALRGDARSAANVPADTTAAPVAIAPTTAAPVVPVTPPATTTAPTTTAKKSTPAPVTPAPSTPSSGTGLATPVPVTPSTGSSSSSSGGGTSSATTTATTPTTTATTPTTTEDETPSGPIAFAPGQGSIYDPDNLAADKGDEANAIDGSTGTSWKVVLNAGATSGLGYVMDFSPATTLKSLGVATATAGLRIKVLGTTKSTLPPDVLDNGWETIASERTLKAGKNTVPLKAVSGATSKYRHVLVLFTTVPGTPPTAVIREFTVSR